MALIDKVVSTKGKKKQMNAGIKNPIGKEIGNRIRRRAAQLLSEGTSPSQVSSITGLPPRMVLSLPECPPVSLLDATPERVKYPVHYKAGHPGVYFITAPDIADYPVKIGCTNNIEKRIKAIGACNPYELKCLLFIPCKTAVAAFSLETEYHEKFRYCRMSGEWFRRAPVAKFLEEYNNILV